MTGYWKQTYAKKYALWRSYRAKCFYCNLPLLFSDMHVDHIIPKALTVSPQRFDKVIKDYEIASGFSIDGLSNQVPCHSRCNRRKGADLFDKKTTLYYLSLTSKKLPDIMGELSRLGTTKEKERTYGQLLVQLEQGVISESVLLDVIAEWQYWLTVGEPVVITLGLNYAEAMEMMGAIDAPEYVSGCDQLEKELDLTIRRLTNHSFYYTESSSRNGETLSVRLVFPELDLSHFSNIPISSIFETLPWWELLEVRNVYEVYGERYSEGIGNSH